MSILEDFLHRVFASGSDDAFKDTVVDPFANIEDEKLNIEKHYYKADKKFLQDLNIIIDQQINKYKSFKEDMETYKGLKRLSYLKDIIDAIIKEIVLSMNVSEEALKEMFTAEDDDAGTLENYIYQRLYDSYFKESARLNKIKKQLMFLDEFFQMYVANTNLLKTWLDQQFSSSSDDFLKDTLSLLNTYKILKLKRFDEITEEEIQSFKDQFNKYFDNYSGNFDKMELISKELKKAGR